MKPQDLVSVIQESAAGNLESIVLYGSAASGHWQPKYSNYNLLILLNKSIETNPWAGQKKFRKWLRLNPPPLVWDLEFFKTSIDVFPLEFMELKQNHQVLWGKPIPAFEVDLHNLRHQCEMELRGRYLRLKNHPAWFVNQPKILMQQLLQTLPSFLSLVKGVLYLSKKLPEDNWNKRIEQLALTVDIHPQILEGLIHIREEKISFPRNDEIPALLEGYLTELKAIIKYVDHLEEVL